MPHTRGATFFLYRLSELALQCPFDSENGRGKTGLKCTQACSVIVSFSTLHFSILYFILCEFSVLCQFSLVLRPAGSITAFQNHVTRSLWRFNVSSPGSSLCWLDHCISTPCDSNTAAVPHWFSWLFALLAQSLRFNTMRLDHCRSSTLDL